MATALLGTNRRRSRSEPVRGRAPAPAAAKPLQPVENQFYGDRIGRFEDPWGHRWAVATHVEDVSPGELARRTQAMGG